MSKSFASIRFSDQPLPVVLTEVIYVTTVAGLEDAVRKLSLASAIGVDVEHNHTRCYYGMSCLLQLHAGVKRHFRIQF
jgi:hypothetical protein